MLERVFFYTFILESLKSVLLKINRFIIVDLQACTFILNVKTMLNRKALHQNIPFKGETENPVDFNNNVIKFIDQIIR